MIKNCKAMVLTGPRKMEMRVFPLPPIGDEDGLLEVELAGVCGSDPAIYEGRPTHGPRPFPLIMGHEIVGRIARIGPGASRRLGVIEKDRVVVEYAFGCGLCDECRGGNYQTCENKMFYGSMVSCQESPHLFGGYSEFLYIHPQAKVHRVGDDISPEKAVLICAVIGNAIRWLRHIGGVSIGDTVAIIGPGQQGIAAAAVASACGAGQVFVIGVASDSARLKMALRFGANRVINAATEQPTAVIAEATHGKMANIIMDVSGSPAGAKLALELAARRGTVVLPGIYKGQSAALDLDRIVLNELKVLGAFSQNSSSVRAAIHLVRQGKYPFAELISHRFPLEEAEAAVLLVAGQGSGDRPLKVVIDPKAHSRKH